jgi:YegS/Rv2252/BmrU family lipid kinase
MSPGSGKDPAGPAAAVPEGVPKPHLRVLTIINPQAGGAETAFLEIGPETLASDLARKAVQSGYDLVLVAGGDGTLAEAAAGLIGSRVPLGIVPSGTANIVAANLAIPMSIREAVRAALHGSPAAFDVGRTDDGRIFLLAAGAGYDADLIRDADRELKRRFGPLAYLLAMFKNLRVRRARYTVEIDARKLHVHAKTVLVCNVGRTLGALPLAPDARVDDGILDVVIFTFRGMPSLFLLFLRAITGTLKTDPRVHFHTGRRIRISASRPMPVQIDGDAVDRTTPIELCVLPGALLVMRPPAKVPLDLAQITGTALKALRDLPVKLAQEAGLATEEPKSDQPPN